MVLSISLLFEHYPHQGLLASVHSRVHGSTGALDITISFTTVRSGAEEHLAEEHPGWKTDQI